MGMDCPREAQCRCILGKVVVTHIGRTGVLRLSRPLCEPFRTDARNFDHQATTREAGIERGVMGNREGGGGTNA